LPNRSKYKYRASGWPQNKKTAKMQFFQPQKAPDEEIPAKMQFFLYKSLEFLEIVLNTCTFAAILLNTSVNRKKTCIFAGFLCCK